MQGGVELGAEPVGLLGGEFEGAVLEQERVTSSGPFGWFVGAGDPAVCGAADEPAGRAAVQEGVAVGVGIGSGTSGLDSSGVASCWGV